MVLDFLSESALLAGERCLAAGRFAINLSWIRTLLQEWWGVCSDPCHGCSVAGVTWASKAQVKVLFYLANGLLSQEQPHMPCTAVTSLCLSALLLPSQAGCAVLVRPRGSWSPA